MAATLPPVQRAEILDRIKGPEPQKGVRGPIKTLVEAQKFDEVRLLSNYAAGWNRWFLAWLGVEANLVQVTLKKPTDYAAIFKIADDELATICKRKDWANTELCLHLSPGTPAMAAVWLLLGKTRYPATFYETYGGESWISDIPFDLTVDVIPELLRDPDIHLQHLASESPSQVKGFTEIAGDSRAIRDAVGRAKRAAMRGVSILLLGETGTGKDMFAKAIHLASPRREKPFRAINCAALSKSLLESELFGHVKGAFTGADRPRVGAFEEVQGGTLFLDEVGECDLETQAKLLRVLQPITDEGPSVRVIRRLGDDKDRKVDVRVIAATNNDLHQSIREGSFREDLYYRLASITITLPPLRDRKSDIPKIAGKLLIQINEQFATEEPNYKHKSLSASAISFVKEHFWPGNARQLYNALVQAAVLTDGENIGRRELAASIGELCESSGSLAGVVDRPLGEGLDLEQHLNDIRRSYLRRAMEEAKGVKVKAARLLGMKNYQTLDAQLKRLEVDGEWGACD
jgi:DNA-binding NtrC family response regulator